MIGKVCARGGRVEGLLYYLFTEGRAGERGLHSAHEDPRVIAGFDDPATLAPGFSETGRRDFRSLVSLLEQPLLAAGVPQESKPVYHLVVAAAKDPETGEMVDRHLSDVEWRDVAEEYMDRIGLAPRGDDAGCRWVAVRHADDHVHIVATLARQDGRRPTLRNDFYRAREASRFVESVYGLTPTADGDRTGRKRPTRAETEKATRRGDREPARETLRKRVRTAAAGATSLDEFFANLSLDGLLVRQRRSNLDPSQVTGFAVALPDRLDPNGKPIYFGGGRLAADLTLPKLLHRWEQTNTTPATPSGARSGEEPRQERVKLTTEERARIWDQATAAAGRATEQIKASAADPGAAGDAAWAASDFLAAAARVVEGRSGGPLTDAADEYDRAARELWGRTPARSAAGQGLRAAGALMYLAQFVKQSETQQLLALLAQLAALSDAVTRLRENQHREAQAAAALRASTGLRAVHAHYATAGPGRRGDAPGRRRPDPGLDLGRSPRTDHGPPDNRRRGPRR